MWPSPPVDPAEFPDGIVVSNVPGRETDAGVHHTGEAWFDGSSQVVFDLV